MRDAPWATPEVERRLDDFWFRFKFRDSTVQIALTGLASSRGEVVFNARTTVLTPAGEPIQHLHWSRINLPSVRSRNDYRKVLEEAHPDALDWARAVEYVCTKTFDMLQEGEAPVDLAEGDPPTELGRVLMTFDGKPGLPFEQTATMGAPGGTFKSMTAMVIASALWLGAPIGPFQPTGTARTLYVDYETTKQEQLLRLDAIARGFGIPRPSVLYLHPRRPLVDLRDEVERRCKGEGIDFVIVDSIGPAIGGALKEDDLVNRFYDALAFWERTALVLGHVPKIERGLKNGQASLFGSVFIENRSRALWIAESADREPATDGEASKVVFTCSKGNNVPRGLRFAATYQWAPSGAITVGTGSFERDADLAGYRSVGARVRDVLARGRVTRKELKEALPDISEGSLAAAISRDPRILAMRNGREVTYGLAANTEPIHFRPGA